MLCVLVVKVTPVLKHLYAFLMNMPRPITKSNYDKSANVIIKATHTVAEETM